jgi:pimeloyl-ACP methyl ester carboxylesterase
MTEQAVYVLIHSPLVGALTWSLVAKEIRRRGLDVIVPILNDSPDSRLPYWEQHAESFAQALAELSKSRPVTLVAHSGAGPLLPVLRRAIPNPVQAYVFVDAGVPHNATRLEMMRSEESNWAQEFQAYLQDGGRFPNWSSEDLQEIIPDEVLRLQLVADLRPRALDFFTESIPVFAGWPDAPCVYVLFSPPYKRAAAEARQNGWKTVELEAGHFHMLVDPKSVTDIIINEINQISS